MNFDASISDRVSIAITTWHDRRNAPRLCSPRCLSHRGLFFSTIVEISYPICPSAVGMKIG